jgi:hypothetical protein
VVVGTVSERGKPSARSLRVLATGKKAERGKPSARSRSLSRISSLRSDSACSDDIVRFAHRERASPFQSTRKTAQHR